MEKKLKGAWRGQIQQVLEFAAGRKREEKNLLVSVCCSFVFSSLFYYLINDNCVDDK